MHQYNKGASFERRIIHDLVNMGALIAMRGAGSKSAGSIKADIMALFPSGYLVIIQAKTSKRKLKKEKEEFEAVYHRTAGEDADTLDKQFNAILEVLQDACSLALACGA